MCQIFISVNFSLARLLWGMEIGNEENVVVSGWSKVNKRNKSKGYLKNEAGNSTIGNWTSTIFFRQELDSLCHYLYVVLFLS